MGLFGSKKKRIKNKGDIIIGIDFGSSGIAFAYGFFEEEKVEPTQGFFENQTGNNKIVSDIILNDKLELVSFGNDCISYLSSTHEEKFHHFQNIKMGLYRREDKIKAKNSDLKVDIKYIITIILKEVKKKAIEQIKRTMPNLDEKKTHWIITVPAIWDIRSKGIMFQAAQEAGLYRDDDDPSNFFALEPEAASIYYYNSPQAIKGLKNIEDSFIICDFGGGTVDIVTQKIEKTDEGLKIKELYPPIGGNNGCNRINELFMERIIKKLFKECFIITQKNVCKKKYYQWIELEQKIEEFKKAFINSKLLNSSFRIDCELFNDSCVANGIRLENLVEKFNSEYPCWKLKIDTSWKILFPYKIIEDLMFELTNEISGYILDIINNVIDIKYLIFTGGASTNPILQQMIQDNEDIKQKNISIVQSHNPELAITQGSVLFAYDHNITSTRKAKYTFGIKALIGWNERIHNNGGKKEKINNSYKCVNYFSKIIKKNEDLSPERELVHEYTMTTSKVTIEIYKTEEDNVHFCDEKDKNGNLKVRKFGEFIIDVGENYDKLKKDAKVCMKLGGTFISVTAVYCKTGEKAKLTCLFE